MSRINHIESMLNCRNSGEIARWVPTPVDDIRNALLPEIFGDDYKAQASNISYSIQYLEFLDIQLEDLKLTSPLIACIIKYYIITAMSIVESVCFNLLRYHNALPLKKWETLIQTKMKEYVESDGSKRRAHAVISKEKEHPTVDDINLKDMLDLIFNEKKGYLKLKPLPQQKSVISYLRELRNKIHLHSLRSHRETDYHMFRPIDYYNVKLFLFDLLRDEKVSSPSPNVFTSKYENALRQYNTFLENSWQFC